jgi:hypothetical protein
VFLFSFNILRRQHNKESFCLQIELLKGFHHIFSCDPNLLSLMVQSLFLSLLLLKIDFSHTRLLRLLFLKGEVFMINIRLAFVSSTRTFILGGTAGEKAWLECK